MTSYKIQILEVLWFVIYSISFSNPGLPIYQYVLDCLFLPLSSFLNLQNVELLSHFCKMSYHYYGNSYLILDSPKFAYYIWVNSV